MPNTKSAKKRMRQNEKRRMNNKGHRSKMKTFVKKFLASVEENNFEKAQKFFPKATSAIDKVARKGIVHKNKAARLKSKLHAKFNALASISKEE